MFEKYFWLYRNDCSNCKWCQPNTYTTHCRKKGKDICLYILQKDLIHSFLDKWQLNDKEQKDCRAFDSNKVDNSFRPIRNSHQENICRPQRNCKSNLFRRQTKKPQNH